MLIKPGRMLFAFVFLCAWIPMTYAEMVTQENVTIQYLTSHDGNVFAFNIREGFSAPCAYGLIYCPSSNSDCKSRYAMALSAKMTGARVREIRYIHNPTDNLCILWLIAVE